MSDFSEKVQEFDEILGKKKKIDTIVPYGDGKVTKVPIKNKNNEKNEEYYRQRFCYGLIESGLFDQDKIGIELSFPKGNANSAPLKIDVCIFDDNDWHNRYKKDDHDWLRQQMIGVAEMKGDVDDTVRKVFSNQLKPAMKENDLTYCWGAVVIAEGVYMFFRDGTKILRYDGSKNEKGGVKRDTRQETAYLSKLKN